MLLEQITHSAKTGYTPATSRRQFIAGSTAFAALGYPILTSGSAEASSPKGNRDLTARIGAFRDSKNYPIYPSFSEYAIKLKMDLEPADTDIMNFLKRPDIIEYIKTVSRQQNIPSYLLAAIVAEERTPTGPIDRVFHGIGERFKSKYGWNTSLGVANVKMSTAAYYLFGSQPTEQGFNELREEQKIEVKKQLDNEKDNLMIASRYLGDLKRKFLEWNVKNIKQEHRITDEEIDANPLALIQLANAYSGGETMLDRSPTGKSRRVIAVLATNPTILQLYDGDKYSEKYRQLRYKKEADLRHAPQLNEIKILLSDGIDSMIRKDFYEGYHKLHDASKKAFTYGFKAELKEWKTQFLAYAAYANAEAGFLLRKANEHRIRVFDDGQRYSHFSGNNSYAKLHYKRALGYYESLESIGVNPETLKVNPKIGWEKTLPSKKDIEKVLSDIELEIYGPPSKKRVSKTK